MGVCAAFFSEHDRRSLYPMGDDGQAGLDGSNKLTESTAHEGSVTGTPEICLSQSEPNPTESIIARSRWVAHD